MVLTIYNIIPAVIFLSELNTLIFFMMVFFNINATVSYCRNAGNPYLNEKCKKYVRKYKGVLVIWNLAFIAKFFFSSKGTMIVQTPDDDDNKSADDFWFSLATMSEILFTEIIPFYFVIDNKFIKIFTL